MKKETQKKENIGNLQQGAVKFSLPDEYDDRLKRYFDDNYNATVQGIEDGVTIVEKAMTAEIFIRTVKKIIEQGNGI